MRLEIRDKVYELIDQLKTREGLKIYPLYKKMESGELDELSVGVEILSVLIKKVIDKEGKIEGEEAVKEYLLDLPMDEFAELSEKAIAHLGRVMEGVKKK